MESMCYSVGSAIDTRLRHTGGFAWNALSGWLPWVMKIRKGFVPPYSTTHANNGGCPLEKREAVGGSRMGVNKTKKSNTPLLGW
jgi:hypothetical protein